MKRKGSLATSYFYHFSFSALPSMNGAVIEFVSFPLSKMKPCMIAPLPPFPPGKEALQGGG